MTSRWVFEERSPRTMNRDPFEAEFFTGDEDTEEVYGRTDALVREAIQNSLDARNPEHTGPVHVRFALSRRDQEIEAAESSQILDGLIPHLAALGNEVVNCDTAIPAMSFLTVEDFGTTGLCGDPGWNGLSIPDDGNSYDFYWFWRNVGRSGKRGTDRGRWGLGKTVFPATSRINTLFGLTVRSTDNRKMLMGQAITRMHELNNRMFVPEGFFCDPTRSEELQLPFEDIGFLEDFARQFGLERTDEPGLSIVVPYPFKRIKTTELLRTVIVHFFYPILRGDLTVAVCGGDSGDRLLTANSIRREAGNLIWDGSPRDKKHAPPPFGLADWAIAQQRENRLVESRTPSDSKVPAWGDHLFEPDTLTDLRDSFEHGNRISIRVPMTIQRKTGETDFTFFDVFIERDSDLTRSDDHFVREGMTISKISTLGTSRGIRGLLVVEDQALSALLGDAEGPAHTNWGTGEARPDQAYMKWKRRVGFVRNGISKLMGLLTPPPAGLDEDWLQDIFSIENPHTEGVRKKKKRRKTPDSPPPAPEPPPPKPRPFEMPDCSDGFRIRGNREIEFVPVRIKVRAAYDVPNGNPFSKNAYSPLDFRFDREHNAPLVFSHSGISFEKREDNVLVFIAEESDFDLAVTGFDKNRDIIVKAVAEEINE